MTANPGAPAPNLSASADLSEVQSARLDCPEGSRKKVCETLPKRTQIFLFSWIFHEVAQLVKCLTNKRADYTLTPPDSKKIWSF